MGALTCLERREDCNLSINLLQLGALKGARLSTPGQSPPPRNNEVVYVIGAPDDTTVKIGRTIDPPGRLATIQRMSPVPLKILWTTPGGYELETRLHRHFSAVRSHGEWFTFGRPPTDIVRRAVEEQPWFRPKVDLAKPKRPSPSKRRLTAEERAAVAKQTLPPHGVAIAGKAQAVLDQVLRNVTSIPDLRERYAAAGEAELELKATLRSCAQAAVVELRRQGLTWNEVGMRLGGLSGQRAQQIATGVTPRGAKSAKP